MEPTLNLRLQHAAAPSVGECLVDVELAGIGVFDHLQ